MNKWKNHPHPQPPQKWLLWDVQNRRLKSRGMRSYYLPLSKLLYSKSELSPSSNFQISMQKVTLFGSYYYPLYPTISLVVMVTYE